MSDVQLRGRDAEETGIYLSTTMHDFDPQAFGEWLGAQDSQTQAGVLTGVALSLYKLGEVYRGHQIAYLTDDLRADPHQREVDEFMDALRDHWKEAVE